MAANKVTTMWTAFLGALVALFAALGFARRAATVQVRQPVVPEASRRRPVRTQGAYVPAARRSLSRGTALPPTIKQRIRAEAHNASPSARRLSADGSGAGASADDTGAADLQPV
ncbi:DUF6344 domain-containing protein [Streptomyces sp. A3M-1-3]|uniref:DUF6344 domain-containing protein n=1 Tax=Streptomyces sp. A3M-1-3 TaxID=2962044 RepID=UPI0020B8E230|nr:DUF6344 domain-containing protein [Streptomyces sp. A3M-1-3]MCP3818031.1 DUF6344 domain-containing protein [Streptomyces sp. A3M-1-3]